MVGPRHGCAFGAKRTVFMKNENIVGYPDHFVQSTERHPMSIWRARSKAADGRKARIGVELDNYWYSAAGACEPCRKNCRTAVRRHHRSRQLAALGQKRCRNRFHPARGEDRRCNACPGHRYCRAGARKNVLVAEIQKRAILGADGYWGDYCAIVPMLPSGLDATAPHLTWDDRPFKKDEGTFFELGGCYRRYHCPLSRTVYLGKPPLKISRRGKGGDSKQPRPDWRRQPKAIAARKSQCLFRTLNRLGFQKDSRTGYSIGLSYPPDWGERTLSLRRGDKTGSRPT